MQLNCCLTDYSLSWKDLLLFCIRPPYAQRHYSWFQTNQLKGHQYVYYVERIPVIGSIASIAEVLFVKINDFFAFRGLTYQTPDVGEELQRKVEKVVKKALPDFEEMNLKEQLNALSGLITEDDLPDTMESWDDSIKIKQHHHKMLLSWKFSILLFDVVREAAEKMEGPEDIKVKMAKIFADQQGNRGNLRVYFRFFYLPSAYEEARLFKRAERTPEREKIYTETLDGWNPSIWKYKSIVYYQEGTKQMLWRTLFNDYCRRVHDQLDPQSFLVPSDGGGYKNDERYGLATIEDQGNWEGIGSVPSS